MIKTRRLGVETRFVERIYMIFKIKLVQIYEKNDSISQVEIQFSFGFNQNNKKQKTNKKKKQLSKQSVHSVSIPFEFRLNRFAGEIQTESVVAFEAEFVFEFERNSV